MSIYPVIMAGGSGTRFWPLSRQKRPKQFLPLTSVHPLITETVRRLKGIAPPKNTLVVCGPLHRATALKALKGIPTKNVLVEPVARNTAPAIALAALEVFRREPEGVLVVLPSDHHVADVVGFRRVIEQAAKIAEKGLLVTLGIKPHRAETGYGYIRLGDAQEEGAHRVRAFVEKPDASTAEGYVSSGEYLWNGGIFAFRADAILTAFREHMPDLHAALQPLSKAVGKRNYPTILKRVFAKLPSISIDYGVMERAANLAVLPADFGWSDVGSFSALPEVRKADERGNVTSGAQTVLVDCDGCVVLGEKRMLAVVGLKNVVVVDSGDALLVVAKEKSQDVRQVVEQLKLRRLDHLL